LIPTNTNNITVNSTTPLKQNKPHSKTNNSQVYPQGPHIFPPNFGVNFTGPQNPIGANGTLNFSFPQGFEQNTQNPNPFGLLTPPPQFNSNNPFAPNFPAPNNTNTNMTNSFRFNLSHNKPHGPFGFNHSTNITGPKRSVDL